MQTEAPLSEDGPEVGTKLEIISPAKVRRRFEGDSEDLGAAEVGDVIEVIETQLTAVGVWRVCFSDPKGDDPEDRRWMSMVAGDGTQLLRAVRGLRDWIPPAVVQEMAEEYIVVSSVKVRQAFEKDSKVIMEFEPGTQRKPSKVIFFPRISSFPCSFSLHSCSRSFVVWVTGQTTGGAKGREQCLAAEGSVWMGQHA